MQALVVIARTVFRSSHHIYRAMPADHPIDHRSRVYSDLSALPEQPGSSEGVSPVPKVETCQILVPESAWNAYTEPLSVATINRLCVVLFGNFSFEA